MRFGSGACIVVAVLALAGCAGSVPKPEYSSPDGQRRLVDADDTVSVSVKAAPGVEALKSELQTLTELIEARLGVMRARNPANGVTDDYDVEVELTRFEKGNAFARAMLAGLGQIHIDGEVTLLAGEPRTRVDGFSIDKTFAWGGVYGGATRIEDVMPTFAEGVAAALTGQAEESEQQAEPEAEASAGQQ